MQQNYLLELEGKPAGRFFSFAGGMAKGEVIEEPTGVGHTNLKHIGAVKYQDMELACGTGMSRGFYEWLGNSLSGSHSRQTGAVIALDNKQAPTARLEFREALVKSLVLPELEKSANKEAFMTVSISPEMTQLSKPDAKVELGVYVSNLPKVWNIGNFRIKIDGLETECSHITRVNSLKLGQSIKDFHTGEDRYPQKEPTKMEYSNIVVRLPEMFADGFYKWHEDMVVKGMSSRQYEKSGTLEYFAPNSSQPYFGIQLKGLGLFEIKGSSGLRSKTNNPIEIVMYCEGMKFYAGAAAIK